MKLLVFCLIVQIVFVNCKTAPELPQACSKRDPDFRNCIFKFLNKLIPFMRTGIPEYAFPQIDPLKVPEVDVNQSLNYQITLAGKIKDLLVLGLSDLAIDDLKANGDKLVMTLQLTHPRIYISSKPEIAAIVADQSVDLTGYAKANCTNLKHDLKVAFNTYKKHGVKHFGIEKFIFKSKIGNCHLDYISSNTDLQGLSDYVLKTFNEDPRPILEFLNPVYINYGGSVIRTILEESLRKWPADLLLLD